MVIIIYILILFLIFLQVNSQFSIPIFKKNINKNWGEHSFIYDSISKDMSFDNLIDEENEKGYISHTKNYWKKSPYYRKQWLNPTLKPIFNFIQECLDEYVLQLDIDTEHQKIILTNAYLNYGKNEGTVFHDHGSSLIAGLYYFYLEGELPELIYLDPKVHGPANILPWSNIIYKKENTINYKPEIGDVILWPSYITHGTEQVRGYCNRVYMTFEYHIFSDKIPYFPSLGVD